MRASSANSLVRSHTTRSILIEKKGRTAHNMRSAVFAMQNLLMAFSRNTNKRRVAAVPQRGGTATKFIAALTLPLCLVANLAAPPALADELVISSSSTSTAPPAVNVLPSDNTPPQTVDVSPAENELEAIEAVTNKIVRSELQLLRVATTFHAGWLRPSKWKSWRVFAYKMVGSTLTNTGMILIAASRYQYMNNPSAAPRPYLKSGHICNITAASCMIAGTLGETILDQINERRMRKEHLDPKSALSEFLKVRKNLDSQISDRQTLITQCANLTPTQRAILDADGAVLQDLRDLATLEFHNSFCEVARLRGIRDVANATTIFSAASAEFGGSLNSLLAIADHQPKLVGAAGIGFITSGSSVAVSPLLVSWTGGLARKRASNKLTASGIVSDVDLNTRFDTHCQQLQTLIANADPDERKLLNALDARSSVYALSKAIFDARSDGRVVAKQAERKELKERLAFSSIIGGTNIARGAQLAIAGFHYSDSPTDVFKLVASASTGHIVGTGVWTIDNIQSKVREEMLKKRLKTTKQVSVHGVLLDDLRNLELMEDQMSIY